MPTGRISHTRWWFISSYEPNSRRCCCRAGPPIHSRNILTEWISLEKVFYIGDTGEICLSILRGTLHDLNLQRKQVNHKAAPVHHANCNSTSPMIRPLEAPRKATLTNFVRYPYIVARHSCFRKPQNTERKPIFYSPTDNQTGGFQMRKECKQFLRVPCAGLGFQPFTTYQQAQRAVFASASGLVSSSGLLAWAGRLLMNR